MAGAPASIYDGGQITAPSLVSAPRAGTTTNMPMPAPHYSTIGLVLIAVAVLVLLDMAGFRFAVTVGKR